MSKQNPRVTATDDPALAESLGFTEWSDELGQYVAPASAATTATADTAETGGEGEAAETGSDATSTPEDTSGRRGRGRKT